MAWGAPGLASDAISFYKNQKKERRKKEKKKKNKRMRSEKSKGKEDRGRKERRKEEKKKREGKGREEVYGIDSKAWDHPLKVGGIGLFAREELTQDHSV